ncbi:MFS transporter [Actinomycetospora cinnamomea]|uniref:MFS transporter n=1 Tax=Actinomycetospora cinnamomea TaxID=663609 RepID=A0A2U1FM51_9PSEU|nr:MFS transporter [Actinomycetospora cinnamomea]PVZ13120.1 MFS transporter [Actinomycetospora cinnamomea]
MTTDERPRATLAVAGTATFLALVVFTVPLATLPSTATALGAGPAAQAWILSSMSVGLGVALLSVGALGDDVGRRRVLVLGALVVAASSVLGALAPSALVLVAARILQGVGAAALVACSQGLLGHAFPAGTPAARTASSVWGASLGAGIAAGPFLASGLDRLVGWTGAYWASAVAAVVLALVARSLVPESRAAQPRPIDLPGVLVLAAGLAALLAGLVEGRAGFDRPVVLALVGGGAALLVAFVVLERRRAAPMLDMALFTSPAFVAATVGALATGTGIIATTSFLPTVVERGLGSTALAGALLLFAWSGTSVVTAVLARRLPAAWPGRLQMAAGLLVVAAGQLLLFGLATGDAPASLVPGLVLAGAASGVVNAALGREAVASVPPGRGAMGGGANNTARYVGAAIGVTVIAVVATRPSLGGGAQGLVAGWNDALPISAAFTLVGAAAVAACRPRRVRTPVTSG